MTYLDETSSKEERISLIKTLMTICEGKIYVEAESARIHLILAFIYEHDGDINAACARCSCGDRWFHSSRRESGIYLSPNYSQ
jgi:hypothetical protein